MGYGLLGCSGCDTILCLIHLRVTRLGYMVPGAFECCIGSKAFFVAKQAVSTAKASEWEGSDALRVANAR
jgi:hypothetical protein